MVFIFNRSFHFQKAIIPGAVQTGLWFLDTIMCTLDGGDLKKPSKNVQQYCRKRCRAPLFNTRKKKKKLGSTYLTMTVDVNAISIQAMQRHTPSCHCRNVSCMSRCTAPGLWECCATWSRTRKVLLLAFEIALVACRCRLTLGMNFSAHEHLWHSDKMLGCCAYHM